MDDWHRWFAWFPVTLLSGEIRWLCFVSRKRMGGYNAAWKPDNEWAYSWAHIARRLANRAQ